jgi:hypothetical protein
MSEGLPKVGGQSVRLAGLGFALLFGACGQPASNAHYGALNSSLSAGDTQLHGRINPGMAVDAAHHELVLFGGYQPGNPQAPLDDTWIYRDGSWRAIHQTVAPEGRYGPSMAWDPRGAQVLLYGGRGGRGDFTDTWAWNGISWKRLSGGSSELFSGFASMATDSMRGQVVLHVAGRSAIETWVWDGAGWRFVQSGPGPQGVGRVAFDPLSGGVINVLIDPTAADASDTWQWDGTKWRQLGSATSGLFTKGSPMAMDQPSNRMVLFDGPECGSGGCFSRTWTWDGHTWVLQQRAHTPSQPVGMVTDPQSTRALLLAGRSDSVGLEGMWTWTGDDWVRLGEPISG